MSRPGISAAAPRLQRGASLIVTLVMLTVITAMGISAFLASNAQFRMAANLQFQNIATGYAESAMAQAETWIVTNYNAGGFDTRAAGGLYPKGTFTADPLTMTWDDTTSEKFADAFGNLLGNQRYIIELAVVSKLPANSLSPNACGYTGNAPCPTVKVFRITARGTSIFGTTRIVQSVFAVRINV